jgi:hypothetical protein
MLARARCRECGEVGQFDVGGVATVEEAQARLDGARISQCPFGHHIELEPIRYDVVGIEDGHAPTLDEWKAEMVARGYDLWTTSELYATEIEITGFAFGCPIARVRGQDFRLDFATAPDGDRYYYAIAGTYAEATFGTPPAFQATGEGTSDRGEESRHGRDGVTER